MAVKFIRTCDRCGKVIEERNGYVVEGKEPAKSNAKYGVLSAESHPIFSLKNFHLCPDCCEDFENFMKGQLVCDISDRGVLSEEIDNEQHKEKHNDKLKPGTRKNHRWTEKEDAFLMEKRRSNVKTPKMAKELGLSITQVRSRIKHLDKLKKDKENAKSEVVFGLDGTVYTQDKDKQGWSPEALDLARQHNESCEEPKTTKVSTFVDKSKIKLAPGTHTYHHWTAEEDRAFLNSSGKTLNDLAYQFGTTIAAVRARKNLILNGKVDIHSED